MYYVLCVYDIFLFVCNSRCFFQDGMKSDSQELLLDDTLEEEDGSKQDGLLLPTIAPATPVSSSFILISPSKREESIHQSMTDGFESVHSEFITNRKRLADVNFYAINLSSNFF